MRSSIVAVQLIAIVFFLLGDLVFAALPDAAALEQSASDRGQSIYEARCVSCHANPSTGAPTEASLGKLPKAQIKSAMISGVMRLQANGLSDTELDDLAVFLSSFDTSADVSRKNSALADNLKDNLCQDDLRLSQPPVWNTWGNGLKNARRQSDDNSAFTHSNVSSMKLKWAFAFPEAVRARSQPAVTPQAIFVGSQSGTVYALDSQTGCVWWTFAASAEVRGAITIETDEAGLPANLYFGDFDANVYSIKANNGELRWKRSVQDHPNGTITGSPTLYEGKLFVPMSSLEVISAYSNDYQCCHFRGGILALNSKTGGTEWRMYTTEPPRKQGVNSAGIEQWGPSGAPIWSTPTVDRKRGLLYIGTGENYSSPANDMSDAIIAIDIDDGRVRWVQQTVANDAWNGACIASGDKVNCPEEDGPDFDFGAPPILTTVAGRELILAGQKSGMVYALDPTENGRIIWQRRVGMGGFNGGIHWGMSVDEERLFVAIADTPGHEQTTGDPMPGLHAFDPLTGKSLWSNLHPAKCDDHRHCYFEGLSAAVTSASGLVFAGALSGRLAAYSQASGEILWRTETDIKFDTINGVDGHGGSIDSAGPVIANDLLLINSGYDKWGQIPGNVLLVFELASE